MGSFNYNFAHRHQTLTTAAAVADHASTMVEFVEMLEREERLLGGRLTNYKPAASKKAK